MARSSRQLEVTRRHQQTSGRQIRLRLAALLSGPANQVQVVARLPNSLQLHYSWLIQIRIRQTVCGPLFPFRETIDTELPFLPAALGRVGGCWLCIMIIAFRIQMHHRTNCQLNYGRNLTDLATRATKPRVQFRQFRLQSAGYVVVMMVVATNTIASSRLRRRGGGIDTEEGLVVAFVTLANCNT